MVILNGGNNSQEELDKLSESCPNDLYMQLCYEEYVDLHWYWMFRVNHEKIYDELDLNQIPFIKVHFINFVREPNRKAQFEIHFNEIPNNINYIDVGLNEMGQHFQYPSREINDFGIQMYEIKIDNQRIHHTFWNEFQLHNAGYVEKLFSKQIFVGTFARVSDGWKFYPKMEDLLNQYWLPIYPKNL